MRHLILPVLLAGLLLVVAAPASADTLLLDSVDQSRAADSAQPERGMTMQQVEARFGAPVQRRSAVGQPPITRWEYSGFVVYFESRHVIHAVRKRG